MSDIVFEIIAIFILVFANGFFALSEFSIIASRKSRLHKDSQENKFGAKNAERLHNKPERFLATIQVGITLVGTLLGVFSGALIVDKLTVIIADSPIVFIQESATWISMIIVVFCITILSVVIGELVPKSIALSYPEKYARYVAGPMSLFIKLTSFFSRTLSLLTKFIVKLIGIKNDGHEKSITEEEIKHMILEGADKGVFDETEQQFIHSVFDFTASVVRRAMKPRADVIGFEKNTNPAEIIDGINEHGYSRYPIFNETIDQVVGVIYAKDLIGIDVTDSNFHLSSIIRDPLFVPDSMPLPTLLKEFQKGKNHIAIVLDEFGGTYGIITLEDIIEEIVGEIQDEYDEEAPPIVKHSDNVVYADGTVWPGEVNELLGSQLPEDQADTLAGLFIDSIGRFPVKNESVVIDDIRLTVLAKEKNRIIRIKADKIENEELTDSE